MRNEYRNEYHTTPPLKVEGFYPEFSSPQTSLQGSFAEQNSQVCSVASPLSQKFYDTFGMKTVGGFYPSCKIYSDGSHYIAIPHTEKPYKPRPKKKEEIITVKPPSENKPPAEEEIALQKESVPLIDGALLPLEKIAVTGEMPREEEPEQPANILQPNERRMTKKELFNELYQEYLFLKKRERREKLIEALRPYFKNDSAVKHFVDSNLERKQRNLIARRIRLTRKVNLQDFNYFVTFTYNSELHTEETFRSKLKNCLKLLSSRKGWKYVGVWERSPEKQRLHFHGLFFIPEGTMPGILFQQRDYSLKNNRMQETTQNTYFNQRFGRSDFEKIEDEACLGDAMNYLMKYIEKTGEKIVYSRGMPQYFISDIIEDDVVTTTGIEDKKLLLFDDFGCWDEGEYLGAVSKDVIKQMRKSN